MPDPFADLTARLRRTLPDAHMQPTRLPGLEDIELGLINADYQTGPLDADVMHAVLAAPAYWAFCWGSGLALARWLRETPELVRHKRVLDLGSGSGIGAIAAARAGAGKVMACDNDPDALAATAANAAHNGVNVACYADLAEVPTPIDLVLLADVLYDRSNFALLAHARTLASDVLVADSRVADVEDTSFSVVHRAQALTIPNLGEFDEFRCVRFFRSQASRV